MTRTILKPLSRQTLVLTGATSGIGLATARMASRRGAALVLVARNEAALQGLCEELRRDGGRCAYAVADVADVAQLRAASKVAHDQFGGFDSWINDAGAFLYGAFDATTLNDQRRVFDVVYWGTVHGTLVADETMARSGGAIVNVGSVLGELAIPFQGPYCAAKFAVKGFTEAYRREAAAQGRPISVSLIKPAAIDTAFMEHARNRIGAPGTRNPPPAYHPNLVARAILHACEHPVRDLVVGGAGGLSLVIANRLAPGLMDLGLATFGRRMQSSSDPGSAAMRDNLYEPREDGHERSTLGPMTRKTSLLLEAQLYPGRAAAVIGGVAALLAARAKLRRRRR